MIAIDLFSGAGGLAEGFTREGFKVASHVEKERWMCETLRTRAIYNYLLSEGELGLYFDYLRSGTTYRNIDEGRRPLFQANEGLEKLINDSVICKAFGNPTEELGTHNITEIIADIEKGLRNIDASKVDVVIGGPPCQAFSVVARHAQNKNRDDIKLNLYTYYLEILKHFSPEVFVFENVPGILNMLNGAIFRKICEGFDSAGFELISPSDGIISDLIFNATEFGVCQMRRRVILIGKKKKRRIENTDISKYLKSRTEDLTTEIAIADLPPIQSGEGDDFTLQEYPEMDRPLSAFQELMRRNSPGVINHKARPNIERDLEIYRMVIKEEIHRYNELPERLKTHKNVTSFEDRFKVHRWDKVPHTIMAHISKDGHYNIHPDINQCRSLTVREAARIQSFPDNYKFEGPRTAQFIQVGNAVPPLMAQTIAGAVKEMLQGGNDSGQ